MHWKFAVIGFLPVGIHRRIDGMAAAIQRQDLAMWAATNNVALAR